MGDFHHAPRPTRADEPARPRRTSSVRRRSRYPPDLTARAPRFDLLGDPTRLSILTCLHAAGPIAVTDLAVATGLKDTTVSQALRLLRGQGAVTAHRDGRVRRYTIADAAITALLIFDSTAGSGPTSLRADASPDHEGNQEHAEQLLQ